MKVVVIGAGVGGLACGARLAASGADVTVLEQSAEIGGKLGVWRQDGFTFDTGPSLLTLPWTLRDTLEALGAPSLPLRRLDPIARYRFAEGTWLDAHSDDDAFDAALDTALHPGAGPQWRALMQRAERIWDAAAGPVLQRPLRGLRDLLPLARRPADIAAVAPHRTMRALGEEYLSDPRLRVFLDRYATYTGSDPRRAPAALVTVPYAERRWGGWYVDGGLGLIAEALRTALERHGGRVWTESRVASVLTTDDGRVRGVRLEAGAPGPTATGPTATGPTGTGPGATIEADLVVANADADQVVNRLLAPDRAPPSLRRRVRRAPRSLSGYVLLLGVADDDGPPPAHHTVLFPADYDAEFDALFGPSPSYVREPTIYCSVPPDPATAPAGHRAWFVLVNAPRTDQVRRPPEGYADHLLALMAARGVDIRDRVVSRAVLTPADLRDRTLTPGGAIYGTSSNGPMAAFLRPPNVSGVPGLYLVGGSSHPGGGLPLVLLSARIVAEQVTAAA